MFKPDQKEFKNLTEHLKYLESPCLYELSDICYFLEDDIYNFDCNTEDSQLLYLYLQFINVRQTDLNIMKNQIALENNNLSKEIKYLENSNGDLERELRIVIKEKIEILDEKDKLEQEISKFKVN